MMRNSTCSPAACLAKGFDQSKRRSVGALRAGHCLHTAVEIRQAERLDQIIRGTAVEALYLVGYLIVRGQNDDRHIVAAATQPAKQRQAISVGKAQIEQD